MYNPVTAEMLRIMPEIDNISNEYMPQYLSKVYARIVCLRKKYEDGEIAFDDADLQEDRRGLEDISNTLLLYLMSERNEEQKRNIAYIAAESRILISIIRGHNNGCLSLNCIPEDVYSTLLFLISGNFAEANEMAARIIVDSRNKAEDYVIDAVKSLAKGYVQKIISVSFCEYEEDKSRFDYGEYLIWKEIYSGIQQLSNYLLGQGDFSVESFEKIRCLSVGEERGGSKIIYSGSFLFSFLLVEVAYQLQRCAVINVECPCGVDSQVWINSLKRQAKYRPYLWNNHLDAIEKGALNPGVSSVITFPTGAGKTTLTELKILSTFLSGRRILYIVPTHALENQVNRNLERLCQRVAPTIINRDGEFSLIDTEEDAIMVMTPEKCITLLKLFAEQFHDVGLVVFDEFHIIDKRNGRSFISMLVVLELLKKLPNADYMMLSAMVKNGLEISEWISTITKRTCLNLDSLWKPTCQLQGCMVYPSDEIAELRQKINDAYTIKRTKTPTKKLNSQMIVSPSCLFSLTTIWDTNKVVNYFPMNLSDKKVHLSIGNNWYLSANYNEVAIELAARFANTSQKVIVFVLDPRTAVSLLEKSHNYGGEDKSNYIQENHALEMQRIICELGTWKSSYLSACKSSTIHHGRLIPEERNLSESIFREEDGVNIMLATSTIAQGINFPADVVIIAGSERYNEAQKSLEPIEAHDILNAVGRAGRAGFRSHGTAILIPTHINSMKENTIEGTWFEKIKDSVFSKGDHCLEVIDPMSDIIDDNLLLDNQPEKKLLLSGYSDDVRTKISNSFYAYKFRGKEDEYINEKINKIVEKLSVEENIEDVDRWDSISMANGVRKEVILNLSEWLSKDERIESLCHETVVDIINYMESWLLENPIYFMDLCMFDIRRSKIAKTLGIKPDVQLTKDDICSLFKLLRMYIVGKNFDAIELAATQKPERYVPNARSFVLDVVPQISYMAGVFIQVILELIQCAGLTEHTKDLDVFASCIKEGVTSSEMLRYKFDKKLLRVECHIKYGERG